MVSLELFMVKYRYLHRPFGCDAEPQDLTAEVWSFACFVTNLTVCFLTSEFELHEWAHLAKQFSVSGEFGLNNFYVQLHRHH